MCVCVIESGEGMKVEVVLVQKFVSCCQVHIVWWLVCVCTSIHFRVCVGVCWLLKNLMYTSNSGKSDRFWENVSFLRLTIDRYRLWEGIDHSLRNPNLIHSSHTLWMTVRIQEGTRGRLAMPSTPCCIHTKGERINLSIAVDGSTIKCSLQVLHTQRFNWRGFGRLSVPNCL